MWIDLGCSSEVEFNVPDGFCAGVRKRVRDN